MTKINRGSYLIRYTPNLCERWRIWRRRHKVGEVDSRADVIAASQPITAEAVATPRLPPMLPRVRPVSMLDAHSMLHPDLLPPQPVHPLPVIDETASMASGETHPSLMPAQSRVSVYNTQASRVLRTEGLIDIHMANTTALLREVPQYFDWASNVVEDIVSHLNTSTAATKEF